MNKLPSYNPRDLEDRDFPFFHPKIVGCFSLDDKGNVSFNKRELQILKPEEEILGTSKEYDLNVGFNESIPRIGRLSKHSSLDNILHWILANKNSIDASRDQIFGTDFITRRSLLMKMAMIPYEQKHGAIFRIMKWKNALFICGEKTEEKLYQDMNETEEEKRSSYWGKKFEDYMTNLGGFKTSTESAYKLPVDVNSEFRCMFKSKLNKIRLLYDAEMDAYETTLVPSQCKENITLDCDKFVELKTNRILDHPGRRATLCKFKFLSCWAQCYLVGTKNVIFGWKDGEGIVRSVEKIGVEEMLSSALGWKGEVCFNFLLDLLKFLQETVQENSLTQVYRMTYDPGYAGLCLEIEEETEPFIPEWFHSHFQ